MRAVVADTGPLFAANDDNDEHHRRSVRDLEYFAKGRWEILVCYPVLLETYSLLLFKMGRRAALGWLDEVGPSTFLSPNAQDFIRAIQTVQGLPDQRITLVDATIAAIATRLGLEVWTYDHHFDVMRVPVWRGPQG